MTKIKTTEQKLRKRFGSFAKLVNEMAEQPKVSQEFIQEIEDAVNCLGIILFTHDDRFKEIKEELENEETSEK